MSVCQRLLGADRRSARTAKQRLQLVLVHDRSDLTPGKLEAMKDELISVISRHVAVDAPAVTVSLTRERHRQRLVADIPLAPPRARRREAG
jgi:cell division topological specificity factor